MKDLHVCFLSEWFVFQPPVFPEPWKLGLMPSLNAGLTFFDEHTLYQPSPTFLAPGTGFMEDNFSMDSWGEGMFSGWFKHIAFIVHFTSTIITSAPPQVISIRSCKLGTPSQKDQEDFAILPAFLLLLSLVYLCWGILKTCFLVWSDDWQPEHHMGAVRNADSWAPAFFLGSHTRRHTCLGDPLLGALRWTSGLGVSV